jgi:uncharacterized protein YqgC (DUF456 family)
MKSKFPSITKNSVLDKSIWVGLIVSILAYLGLGLVGLVSYASGVGLFLTSVFLITAVVVIVINLLYDYVQSGGKKYYTTHDIVAGVLVAILLPLLDGFFGVTSVSSLNLVTFIGTLISVIILEWVGIEIARKVL